MLIRRELAGLLTKAKEKDFFVSWEELNKTGLRLHLNAVHFLLASIGKRATQTGTGIFIEDVKDKNGV